MKAWLKDNGPVIGALAGTAAAFVAILQIFVVGPMNRNFDAVNLRFDDLRSEMNERFGDMQEGVDQRLGAMDQRIGELRTDMNQRFGDLRSEMNTRFDAQDKYMKTRFDAVDQRLDGLGNDVSDLRALSDRVSVNEGQIRIILEQVQAADTPTQGP